jgi:heme-binding protein
MESTVANHSRSGLIGVRRSLGSRIAASSLVLMWVLVSFFVHPLRHEISGRPGAPLLSGAEVAPAVADVLNHACVNCHSEKTRWPWYSQVAPVSWLVEGDVKRARKHLNLSRWDGLDTTEQRLLLTAIGTVIENREMPPHRYLMLHPEAKLSVDDSVQVIEWTRAERLRLRGSAGTFTLK